MGIFSASTRALVQQAIDLMVRGSATQIPLSDDVVYPLGKASASAGFMGEGDFRATIQNSPFSTLLTFLTWLDSRASGGGGAAIPIDLSPDSIDEATAFGYTLATSVPATGAEILATTVAGNSIMSSPTLVSLTAPNLISCGGMACSSSDALLIVSFPKLVTVINGASVAFAGDGNLPSLVFPELVSSGGFTVGSNSKLITLGAPKLATLISFTVNNCALLPSVSFPSLTTTGSFNVATLAAATSVSFPELASTVTSFTCSGMGLLTSLDFSKLATVGTTLAMDGLSTLPSVTFPALTSVGGNANITNSTGITSISCPNLVTINGNITSNSLANLTTVNFPAWLPTNTKTINFSGAKLTAASVNHILARCVASASYLTGAITLNGGTNAAPTGQGITDKATLITRGHTVTTN